MRKSFFSMIIAFSMLLFLPGFASAADVDLSVVGHEVVASGGDAQCSTCHAAKEVVSQSAGLIVSGSVGGSGEGLRLLLDKEKSLGCYSCHGAEEVTEHLPGGFVVAVW